METALQFFGVKLVFTLIGAYVGARWGLKQGGLEASPVKQLLGLD